MKTRAEAVELIKRQLEGPDQDVETPDNKTVEYRRQKGGMWHYGRQDLRELLDFIYGGAPTDPSEIIPKAP